MMLKAEKAGGKANTIITSNFKMGNIDRLNTELRNTRVQYGDRNTMDETAPSKQEKF